MTFTPSDEQRAVIIHRLGPLRVMAGAGTGKTTTIAHRIAHLVETHGIEPEQVLGITFTNKAADELAGRVHEALGDRIEPGRQIDVHTYHGFAALLMREFGPLVGVDGDSPVITPTFTRQLIDEIMATVDLPHLNQTWNGTVDHIRRLASQMADHLVDVEDVEATHEPGFPNAGPDVVERRTDLLVAIRRYRSEKRRLGVVDYGDLLASAHRLVTRHPWVSHRVRSRYRAVFLDEYQDTNPAQRLLLTAIFDDGFPVTAVGDPDQTIYEWRGASMGNFRRFPEHFSQVDGTSAPSLPLTRNRRSGHAILDIANRIRAQIDQDRRPALRALDGASDGEVRCGWFADAVAEAEWLADDVLARRSGGCDWRDIGVLFRKNRDIAVVRDALAARDIPVEVANLGGLLSVPEVVELHAWLRLLDEPADGPALARILTGSHHRLGLGDLAVLARWTRDRRPDTGAEPLLLESLEHLSEIDGIGDGARESLQRFAQRYRGLVATAQSATLVELSRAILDEIGAWEDTEAMSDAGRLSARLNLYRFLDLAEQWSPLEGRPTLRAFLSHLDVMDQEPAEELDAARLAGADAVTLLTVHRAKGLEWPIVYLPGTRHNGFPSGVVGSYDNPWTRPESLPYELRLDREDLPPLHAAATPDDQTALLRERHTAQEWRIAYVAATRARAALTVTGAFWYGQPEPPVRPGRPSALYDLVAGAPSTVVVASCADPGPRPETLRSEDRRLRPPDPLFPEGGWQEALRLSLTDPSAMEAMADGAGIGPAYEEALDRLQGMLFRLPERPEPSNGAERSTSVTGLVVYASCPLRFNWAEIDRLPRRPSQAARRGTEVHRRIELHHRGVMALEEYRPDAYDVIPGETSPTPGSVHAFEAFERSRFAAERPRLVETPFELRLGRATTVRGRVDAVYDHGDGHWEIVDFKSGRPTADPAALVQLQAYALAMDAGGLVADEVDRLDVTFAHLGDGLDEQTWHADPAWLDAAAERLGNLAGGIESEAFEPTPSPACRRCDFLHVCPAGQEEVAG